MGINSAKFRWYLFLRLDEFTKSVDVKEVLGLSLDAARLRVRRRRMKIKDKWKSKAGKPGWRV